MPGPRSLVELAAAPGHEPALLADLARSGSIEVRAALATNRELPDETAMRLAKDRSADVRAALAASGRTIPAVVELLADDRVESVRCALLDALTDRYRSFGQDKDPRKEALSVAAERLSRDPDPGLRAKCAGLLALPLSCHETLCGDPEAVVRSSLASNIRVGAALLACLAHDPEPDVAAAALRNPFAPIEMVEEAAESSVVARRAAAAANPIVGRTHACRLLHDDELAVAAAAAGNPRVPLTELVDLYGRLPPNPPSHRGAKKPYAPAGSLIDYVEDRLARHHGYCTCGSPLATERFEWPGPVLDYRRREDGRAWFWKAWCQGACGRGWRLDPSRRHARDERTHDPLLLLDADVTDELIAAGEGLVDAPTPPDRYAPFLDQFGPLEFDRSARLPVMWGFPISAWAPEPVVEAIEHDDETTYLGMDYSQDHALRCSRHALVARRLGRIDASSVYGPYQGDNFESGYGTTRWVAVGFGSAWFSSRWMAPGDEERDDAESGWRERVERERVEQARAAAEREETRRCNEDARRAQRDARTAQALELLGGPIEPPADFADCLGGFRAVTSDAYCGETIGWGFPIQRRISPTRWQELGRHGTLVYVGEPPGILRHSPGAPTCVLVCRTLTREVATQVYGPVTTEDRGPRGGWRSVTLGTTTFASRELAG